MKNLGMTILLFIILTSLIQCLYILSGSNLRNSLHNIANPFRVMDGYERVVLSVFILLIILDTIIPYGKKIWNQNSRKKRVSNVQKPKN